MPSKTLKQARFMQAIAHNPKFAKTVGVPQSVGKDFAAADQKAKNLAGGGLVTKIGPLLEGLADSVKGTKVADVFGKPVEVYHGSGNQIKGPIKSPAFFTTDKSGAEWYAKNRGDSTPTIHKAMLDIKNPLDISNKQGAMKLIKHAEDAGVHVNVKDPGNGEPWEFYSSDISKHSPYDGESPQDLLYVPKVREALKKAGHDGVFLHDTLENSTIPTWVPLDHNQVRHIGADAVEDAQNFADGGSVSQVSRDREASAQAAHSAQVLKQMARGWLAGTVGMPGDLEGLARHLIPGISNTPFLPTSDFYKEWLPGASEDPRLQEAADIGSWTGGAGVGTPLKMAGKAVTKAGKPLVEHAGRILDAGMHGEGALAKVLAPAQPSFAVKPKGGNWSVEGYGHNPADAFGYYDVAAQNTTAPNKWRDKQLVNYIKNQMGTVDDPLLKLEQEGRLHMTPDQMEELASEYGKAPYPAGEADNTMYRVRPNSSKADKFHYETTGRNYRTPWENLSDAAIHPSNPAEELSIIKDMSTYGPSMNGQNVTAMSLDDIIAAHPENADLVKHKWLETAPKDTKIYGMGDPSGLGFQHMMDYMDTANAAGQALEHHGSLEAMRKAAENALPNAPIHDFIPLVERNLHLTDDAIGRSSVADIAAKTGEWNKVLSQAKTLRAQANVPDFKTYETGHKWKAVPDTAASDDGLNFCMNAGKDAGWCTQTTGLAQRYGGSGNQLYILHDAAGKPKVQIAVNPGQDGYVPWSGLTDADKSSMSLSKELEGVNLENLKDTHWFDPKTDTVQKISDVAPSIQEIKGRMNRKPDPEDLPMVQDFVKSGKWSRVGDIQNSGLRKTSDAFNENELTQIKAAGFEPGEYHTPDELKEMSDGTWAPPPDAHNFAKGGRVLLHKKSGQFNTKTYMPAHDDHLPRGGYEKLMTRFNPGGNELPVREIFDAYSKETLGGGTIGNHDSFSRWVEKQ